MKPTTTVSACKGLPTCSKCGDILPMFDKHECTPTNPPTETVSDCCGAKLEVIRHSGDEGNGVYICGKCHIYCSPKTPTEPKIGIDETMYASNQGNIQTTGTTPTSPTVEKWEKLSSLGLSETQKKAISYMHFHSVQEAKAVERKLVVGEIKDNLRVIKKGTTGDMRTAISSVEAMWALNTDPEYRAIYKSSDEYKKDITKAEIKLIERIISFRSPYVYDKYSSLGQQGNQINSEYFIEEGKLLESIRTDLLASLKQEEEA